MDVDMRDVDMPMVAGLPIPSLPPKLFEDVIYTVISPPQLPGEDPGLFEVIEELDKHGATYISLNPDTNRIRNLGELTHIISNTSDFQDYEDALDKFIHVVKPSWVRNSVARMKHPNPRQYSPDPALIMSEVVVCCAGIPEGDKEAIMGGVLAMGGLCSEFLSRLVTHLVALTVDDAKVETCLQRRLPCKIVAPHWFDDCLRLGKKISEEPYLFPDPEIFALEHDGPPAPRNNEDLRSALTPVPHTVQSSLAAPREATIFRKRVIRLSNDLKVGSRTRGALEDIIRNGGGGIVDCVAGADIYVGQYRDGPEFVQAYEDGLDIGNLSWLYYLIAHNKWTNPMRRLLHYPVPLKGIPGFEAYNISISNYTGDARVYLESLIKACGAQFTKTMKQDNTHLITGHTSGEKCEAALEWNIHMVNHLWLEDSYAQYNEQSITIKRYTHFPLRTNLGEVMGQTPIDRIALEENFLPMPKKHVRHLSDAKIDHVPQSSVVPQEKKAVYTSKALQNTSHLGEDVPPVDRKEKLSINDTFATPSRNAAGGKENETPLTTGSRASKTAALSKLHDNALDIALYDKERKRVGGVTHGRDRRSGVDELMDGSRSDGESRKRKSADSDEDTDDDDDDETAGIEARPGKKAKTEKKPAIKHRMLLTMYDRWTKSPKVQQEDKTKLRNLGILIVERPTAEISILCAPRIVRTAKFVCGLAYAPEVVSTSFLDHCLTRMEIPPLHEHWLADEDGQKKMGSTISETLKRAKQNNRKLLKGWQIFCTDKIAGGFDTYKEIIEVNDGSCHQFKGRVNTIVSKRVVNKDIPEANRRDDKGDILYLLSGSTLEEVALKEKFKKMAREAGMVPCVVKPDWLLGITMSQKIYWEDEWELL